MQSKLDDGYDELTNAVTVADVSDTLKKRLVFSIASAKFAQVDNDKSSEDWHVSDRNEQTIIAAHRVLVACSDNAGMDLHSLHKSVMDTLKRHLPRNSFKFARALARRSCSSRHVPLSFMSVPVIMGKLKMVLQQIAELPKFTLKCEEPVRSKVPCYRMDSGSDVEGAMEEPEESIDGSSDDSWQSADVAAGCSGNPPYVAETVAIVESRPSCEDNLSENRSDDEFKASCTKDATALNCNACSPDYVTGGGLEDVASAPSCGMESFGDAAQDELIVPKLLGDAQATGLAHELTQEFLESIAAPPNVESEVKFVVETDPLLCRARRLLVCYLEGVAFAGNADEREETQLFMIPFSIDGAPKFLDGDICNGVAILEAEKSVDSEDICDTCARLLAQNLEKFDDITCKLDACAMRDSRYIDQESLALDDPDACTHIELDYNTLVEWQREHDLAYEDQCRLQEQLESEEDDDELTLREGDGHVHEGLQEVWNIPKHVQRQKS